MMLLALTMWWPAILDTVGLGRVEALGMAVHVSNPVCSQLLKPVFVWQQLTSRAPWLACCRTSTLSTPASGATALTRAGSHSSVMTTHTPTAATWSAPTTSTSGGSHTFA